MARDRHARRIELGHYILATHIQPTVVGARKVRNVLAYVEAEVTQETRLLHLRATCSGVPRLLTINQFGLAATLAGDHFNDAFLEATRQANPDWVAEAIGNAMLTPTGRVRNFDGPSARHRLRLVALQAMLQTNGKVLGLPIGAFRNLLGDWIRKDHTHQFTPLHRNTVSGYIREMREAGLIETSQPYGWETPAWLRGRPRHNAEGQLEVWAYNQYRLLGAWPEIRPVLPVEPRDESEEALLDWIAGIRRANAKPREGSWWPARGVRTPEGSRGPPEH